MSLESNDKADMIHESVRRKETGSTGVGFGALTSSHRHPVPVLENAARTISGF